MKTRFNDNGEFEIVTEISETIITPLEGEFLKECFSKTFNFGRCDRGCWFGPQLTPEFAEDMVAYSKLDIDSLLIKLYEWRIIQFECTIATLPRTPETLNYILPIIRVGDKESEKIFETLKA